MIVKRDLQDEREGRKSGLDFILRVSAAGVWLVSGGCGGAKVNVQRV